MDEIFDNVGELPMPGGRDASPMLYSHRLAAYEWGGGEITFYPTAGFSKKGFLTNNLFALEHGYFHDANTQEDMICLLAFLHEYRHYQQDMLTGTGHWDYAARVKQIIKTLSLAKQMSQDGTVSKPLDEGMAEHARSLSIGLLHRSEEEEISLIQAALAKSEPNANQLAPLFTLRRLLEADAVLHVYLLVIRSRQTERTAAALEALTSIYQFYTMPEPYSETLAVVLRTYLTRVHEDIDEAQKLQNFICHTRVLLTMSLAHPDPDTLSKLGHDANDYLPGVRFVRLLQASIKQMLAPNENPRSFQEREASLLAKAGFPYPSYYDCETGWARYFENKREDPSPALTEARLDALKQKYPPNEGPEEAIESVYGDSSGGSVMTFTVYDLPLLMRRTDGKPQDVLLTARGMAKPEYDFDRLRHLLAWRLSDFISRRRSTLACPFFLSHHCDAKTERCRQPYTNLNDVPISGACRIRATCFDKDPRSLRL